MKLSNITYRIILATFVLVSFSIYGSGCSSSGGKTPTIMQTAANTNPSTNPSSEGGVSYSKDIQPIFTNSCAISNCHGTNPPSGLKLTSYADFNKGGTIGKAYVVGNSADSLVIKRLEGKIKPRMPRGGVPLSPDQIKMIKDWIDAGAKDN